eukprot:497684_1
MCLILFLILSIFTNINESAIKGVAVQSTLCNNKDFEVLNASWYWNWKTNDPCSNQTFSEYIPMIWSRANISQINHLPPNTKWLMGFNEPNNGYVGQDVMTPVQACQYWPQFTATKLKLLSPGVAEGGTMSGIDWLTGFFQCCGGYNCVDAIAIHIYETDYNKVINVIQSYHNAFPSVPIWLTEICDPHQNEDISSKYLKNLLPLLDKLDYLERYSWVADRWNFDSNCAGSTLLPANNLNSFQLTECGTVFQQYKSKAT